MNIIWLGDNLKWVIDNYLFPMYEEQLKINKISKKFLILHRTPSEIVDSNIQYEMITMPRCEEMLSNSHTNCKYELMPLLKYYSEELTYSNALHNAMLHMDFEETGFRRLFKLYDNMIQRSYTNNKNAITKQSNQFKDIIPAYNQKLKLMKTGSTPVSKIYNDVACDWIKQSKDIYKYWFDVDNDMEVIFIGGIFPITAAGAAYSGRVSRLS